jgi:hypothetical protein
MHRRNRIISIISPKMTVLGNISAEIGQKKMFKIPAKVV